MVSFIFGCNLNDSIVVVRSFSMANAMKEAAKELHVKTCNLIFIKLA